MGSLVLSNTLEVLVSTMNRTSLSFLEKMFPHQDIKQLNILIVNQTTKGRELTSKLKNIRVVNSYEKGLSKSRNLAIKNAVGDICLIADDDVEYVKEFETITKEGFIKFPEATIIRFKIDTFTGEQYKAYPKTGGQLLSRKSIKPTSSIEIAFKRKAILEKGIAFNTLFGLGSYFQSGEEYLFLKKAISNGLSVYFVNSTIVKHALERSTSNMGSDNYVKTICAINYLEFKNFSYILLLKYIFFLVVNGAVSIRGSFNKLLVGFKGINQCRQLTKSV
ncbi:glycosyl transferase family 2 [Jejuia pallidilutea]|uniref:Glycosyl transferase family 2 n=1 Tax=Jejuia pallidilutea TaxID=504487 RepID=A0A362WZB5_9FLAO|nr:glycosyltransferase family 2 protein [Jejuia pallidilutea]PQV48205.1 glycosyl transferase family 2 [Jejuia pallidilutea]